MAADTSSDVGDDPQPPAFPSGADIAPRPAHTPLHFPGCSMPTLGVEMEVWLVDRASRCLAPKAQAVLAALGPTQHAKAELFRTIVELNTAVCQSVAEVRADLQGCLDALQRVCAPHHIGLMCTGTHPIADWRHTPTTADSRYTALIERMQWPARRMLICGLHVHVGVKSGEHAIAIMNAMTVFLPHLLALSASSPYWHGIDTGMASCRAKVFEGLPTAGLPPPIKNWGEFVALMGTLKTAQSIQSVREIWWDIRPHPAFGTVEVRICDGVNTLQEVAAIAAFVQCMVHTLQQMYDAGEALPSLRHWTLTENRWRAARHGATARLIRNEAGDQVSLRRHLNDWLERLQPAAQELNCVAELQATAEMLHRGSNTTRQRRIFEQTGALTDVVDALLLELSTDAPTPC